MTLDEGKDVLLGQLVWILGLLGVTHVEAISPLPEEPAVVAGMKGGNGFCRESIDGLLGFLIVEELPVIALAKSHGPWLIYGPDNVDTCGHKVPVVASCVAELWGATRALDELHL